MYYDFLEYKSNQTKIIPQEILLHVNHLKNDIDEMVGIVQNCFYIKLYQNTIVRNDTLSD